MTNSQITYSRSDRKLLKATGVFRYVVGLVFSEDAQRVLLLYKTAACVIPVLRDTWNGVGGKINRSEFPSTAMRRECQEETGLDIPKWQIIEVITDKKLPTVKETFRVYVFMAQGPIDGAVSNGEEVKTFSIDDAKELPLSPGLLYSLERAVSYL